MAVVVLLLVLSVSLFRVQQWERAIVLRFGEIIVNDEGGSRVYEPGLYIKIPFADRVVKMDARIQTADGDSNRIATSEQKDLIVDTYVKWRIENFGQFYRRTNGNLNTAQGLLENTVENALRIEFGKRARHQVVSGERTEVMDILRKDTNTLSPELGIKVVDIRVKKINLPDEVSESVYDRMRKERERIANKHRSDGEREANIIRAKADADVQRILAEADRKARQIRGGADATAAEIYAKTYQKDPEFYAFLRSLDAYKASFDSKQDVLVIKPDSEFFRYFKNPGNK